MRKVILSWTLLCGAVTAQAQTTTTNLVDLLAQQAAQRTNAYDTGADVAQAQQTYIANYWNDSFWESFWSMSSADSSTWLSQMLILRIHATNCIAHLQGSLAWFQACTQVADENGGLPSISYRATGTPYAMVYTVTATIGSQTFTFTDSSVSGAFGQAETAMYNYWAALPTTDPDGQYYSQDYTIIGDAMPNSSAWQLATASQGASPDSSLLSLLVNSTSAQNATNGMTTNIDTTDASLNLTNATFDQAYAAMQSAGAVIPPDAVREPSDAISSIRSIYSSTSTSPIALRSKLLQLLFYDFMNSGSWVGSTYRFSTIRHSSAYRTALGSYTSCVNQLAALYQAVVQDLTGELNEANQNDLTFLSMANTYRSQLTNQPPVTTVISTAQAQQLFSSQVGNTTLSSIPLIGIGAYALWLAGPPWAQTPCFPTSFGCVPNPLYNTIVAQLVRGLSSDGGVVLMPQNAAMNTLKAAEQQQIAVQDIITLATKQTNNALLQTEKTNSYGDSSYHVSAQQASNTVSFLPLYSTNSSDAMVQGVMAGVAASRMASSNLAAQQSNFYSRMTGSGTMIERAALGNEQQAAKTATLEQLNRTINNRIVLKAMEKNEQLQLQKQKQDVQDAQDNSGGLE